MRTYLPSAEALRDDDIVSITKMTRRRRIPADELFGKLVAPVRNQVTIPAPSVVDIIGLSHRDQTVLATRETRIFVHNHVRRRSIREPGRNTPSGNQVQPTRASHATKQPLRSGRRRSEQAHRFANRNQLAMPANEALQLIFLLRTVRFSTYLAPVSATGSHEHVCAVRDENPETRSTDRPDARLGLLGNPECRWQQLLIDDVARCSIQFVKRLAAGNRNEVSVCSGLKPVSGRDVTDSRKRTNSSTGCRRHGAGEDVCICDLYESGAVGSEHANRFADAEWSRNRSKNAHCAKIVRVQNCAFYCLENQDFCTVVGREHSESHCCRLNTSAGDRDNVASVGEFHGGRGLRSFPGLFHYFDCQVFGKSTNPQGTVWVDSNQKWRRTRGRWLDLCKVSIQRYAVRRLDENFSGNAVFRRRADPCTMAIQCPGFERAWDRRGPPCEIYEGRVRTRKLRNCHGCSVWELKRGKLGRTQRENRSSDFIFNDNDLCARFFCYIRRPGERLRSDARICT